MMEVRRKWISNVRYQRQPAQKFNSLEFNDPQQLLCQISSSSNLALIQSQYILIQSRQILIQSQHILIQSRHILIQSRTF